MQYTPPPPRDPQWVATHAESSLRRLLPRIEARFKAQTDAVEWDAYVARLRRHFPRLFDRMYALYGAHYDFFFHLESVLASATEMWLVRPAELKALDALRQADPHWYLSNRMVGAMCYVDRFSGDLAGLRERIPYLKELGISYLHLMPCFEMPAGDNDGGYAVSSYRRVDAAVGSIEELAQLATELRHHGISLTMDFVFNHTSDEHDWAQAALAGDPDYQAYYRLFDSRDLPDAYERTMPEVFTEDHPGAFTYRTRIKRWVWTTFHTYQWDLNYENPAVFNRMLEEMLFLANLGVEILRLDAVAYIWKRLGTNCRNLPEAHWIIQAFNAVVSIAAPAMVFKSEAIVHPDEVNRYISTDECQLSYNPTIMALLWDALATRDVRVLSHATRTRYAIPEGCAWVNYVRCHDDIGWGFADEDLKVAAFDPVSHRRFLNEFYSGRHPGSFSRGLLFQEDHVTGDARVCGMTASLTGLDKALAEADEAEVTLAIRRILLLHGVIITLGGIPLIYLGDEVAMLNDHDFAIHPERAGDARWVHRPAFDWQRAEQRWQADSVPGRVHQGLLRLIALRGQNMAFARGDTECAETGNRHVFGFFRSNEQHVVFVLANFSEQPQALEARRLRQMGMRRTMVDLLAGGVVTAAQELLLGPYQLMVLTRTA